MSSSNVSEGLPSSLTKMSGTFGLISESLGFTLFAGFTSELLPRLLLPRLICSEEGPSFDVGELRAN